MKRDRVIGRLLTAETYWGRSCVAITVTGSEAARAFAADVADHKGDLGDELWLESKSVDQGARSVQREGCQRIEILARVDHRRPAHGLWHMAGLIRAVMLRARRLGGVVTWLPRSYRRRESKGEMYADDRWQR